MFEEKVNDQAVKAYFESMDLDVWDAPWQGLPAFEVSGLAAFKVSSSLGVFGPFTA